MHRFLRERPVCGWKNNIIPYADIIQNDSLAQLVEHNTFNVGVVGSSPTRITKKSELPPQNAENHLISSVFVFVLSGRIQRFSEHKRE